MTPQARKALEYVRNAAGNATADRFFEDHEPIGAELWRELRGLRPDGPRLVDLDEGNFVVLTAAGKAALGESQAGTREDGTMDDWETLRRIRDGLQAQLGPEERAKNQHRDSRLEKTKKDAVEALALVNFGIAASHSDGISAQHPALAGVIRRALREAFDAGVASVARELIDGMLEERGSKGRPPP